jgi:thiosulfate/3-mercaptopyruvate sulfurtransferase
MLPSPEKFSSRVRKLGIGSETHVICYDSNGGPGAAMRAWWTFRIFGHDRVSVLSGGLPKWQDEDRPTSTDETPIIEKHFFSKFDPSLVLSFDQIMANVDSHEYQMVDARAEGRYNGTDEEPRAGMRKGHIPGAINLPFQKLMDTENFMVMRPADDLQTIISDACIDLEKPLVSSCGSGVTAAPLVLALYLLGHTRAAIYDGSWTEWGSRDDTPIEV